MTDPSTTTAHWDGAYARGEQALSWYAPSAAVSVRLITAANVATSAAVIDIGGGTSRLVDALIELGFEDLSVLDVSDAALAETQRRLAGHATNVQWLVQDIRDWRPHRTYGLWHDRAVFHFQANHADRDAYLRALNTGTAPGSVAVFPQVRPGRADPVLGPTPAALQPRAGRCDAGRSVAARVRGARMAPPPPAQFSRSAGPSSAGDSRPEPVNPLKPG